MEATYVSSDDSELLRKSLIGYSGENCLEIGLGYGANLLELSRNFEISVGTDVRKTDGFARLRGKERVSAILSDTASCFRSESFDLVVLNPPYLPCERIEDVAIDGGKNGFEVTARFLEEAERVLRPRGKILLLFSSEESLDEFLTFCKDRNLVYSRIMSKSLFFEELTVFEIRKLFHE